MAAIAPMRATLPERPPGPWVEEPYPLHTWKPESSFALLVPGSSEDSPPAPAAAVSPTFVPFPLPAEPAWAKDPRYIKEHGGPALGPNRKAHREQSIRIAKIALDYYSKKKKIKFELLEVRPVISVPSSFRPYRHINFTARSSKEGSQEQLFFAELQSCSRKKTPSGFSVLCCEPLGSDATAGRAGVEYPEGTSPERENVHSSYCFGCGPYMFHPKGGKYAAGHCTVPHIYECSMI